VSPAAVKDTRVVSPACRAGNRRAPHRGLTGVHRWKSKAAPAAKHWSASIANDLKSWPCRVVSGPIRNHRDTEPLSD